MIVPADGFPAPQTPQSSARVVLTQRLFLQHISAIKGFIFGLLPDYAAVEDVLQEVFLVVTAKSESFDPNSDFLSWVWAITRNKVLQRQRKERSALTTLSPEAIDVLCTSPEAAYSAEVELTAERADALRQCLSRLAPKARQAIELRYADACRPPEIAERLSWTVGSVSVALSRAISTLRDCVMRKLSECESR